MMSDRAFSVLLWALIVAVAAGLLYGIYYLWGIAPPFLKFAVIGIVSAIFWGILKGIFTSESEPDAVRDEHMFMELERRTREIEYEREHALSINQRLEGELNYLREKLGRAIEENVELSQQVATNIVPNSLDSSILLRSVDLLTHVRYDREENELFFKAAGILEALGLIELKDLDDFVQLREKHRKANIDSPLIERRRKPDWHRTKFGSALITGLGKSLVSDKMQPSET